MATWPELRDHITSAYSATAGDSYDVLTVSVNIADRGRSQLVIVTHDESAPSRASSVSVASPFAEVGTVDLYEVVALTREQRCGGVSANGNYLVIRNTLPLPGLAMEDFDNSVVLITSEADELEGTLTGADRL